GGYLLAGVSNTPRHLYLDSEFWTDNYYWIIKVDSLGNKHWERFISNIRYHHFGNLVTTPDGGYLLGGTSSFGDDYRSGSLYKLNEQGEEECRYISKRAISNNIVSLARTTDGGYILGGNYFGGNSKSEDGRQRRPPRLGAGASLGDVPPGDPASGRKAKEESIGALIGWYWGGFLDWRTFGWQMTP
ncbi:MAG: hypothetical protein AAFU64_09120, partial [Bacteroidota bacterium]